jgi:hypothetical protein
MGWFAAKSPVSAEAGAWIERSMDWYLGQFGTALVNDVVLVPEPSFFPQGYRGSPADLEGALVKVCLRMGVDRELIDLELIEADTSPELLATSWGYRSEFEGAAGHFLRRGDRYVVALSEGQLGNPTAVVAVIAHELGHARLLGEGRIERGRRDGEQLTDLVTVALGLGVFNANASFEFQQSSQGWRRSSLGYLSEPMFGYALAYCARQRGETNPAWAARLDTNPRVYMKQATRFIHDLADDNG